MRKACFPKSQTVTAHTVVLLSKTVVCSLLCTHNKKKEIFSSNLEMLQLSINPHQYQSLVLPQRISLHVQVMLWAPLTFFLMLQRFVPVIARRDAVTWMPISSVRTVEKACPDVIYSRSHWLKRRVVRQHWLSQTQLRGKMHIVSKVQQLLWCWKAWPAITW